MMMTTTTTTMVMKSSSFMVSLVYVACICGNPVASTQAAVASESRLTAVNQIEDGHASLTLVFEERRPPGHTSIQRLADSLRQAIASTLNSKLTSDFVTSEGQGHHSTPTNGRRLPYTIEDVAIETGQPTKKNGYLWIPVTYVQKTGGAFISLSDVRASIIRSQEHISHDVGLHLVSIVVDKSLLPKTRHRLPRAEPDATAADAAAAAAGAAAVPEHSTPAPPGEEKEKEKESIWEAHWGLFIAVIIFICISIVLTIICCICFQCRKRLTSSANKQPEKTDAEKMLVASSDPMQEQSLSHEPPPVDEENGWIIPLDQMTKEELEQPEVQVSRL